MIRTRRLDLALPGFSLKGVDIHVREKEFFALIGPTGSGKSLLLEAIMGLMPIDGGKIFVNGRDVTNFPVEKRKLAIVYQDFALFPHLDVTRNILYGVKYHGISQGTVLSRFDMLVTTLGLRNLVKRYPESLSGGEKQRVALARSLILNPRAILLDEPLSALDPVFQEDIKELLKSIHSSFGVTFIMVSHNFSDVLYLAERGAVINRGRIMQAGTIQEIFDRPDSFFTAKFVGMKNVFSFCVRDRGLDIGNGDLSLVSENNVRPAHTHAGIRPEELVLLGEGGGNGYANRFKGEITRLSNHGIYFTVDLKVKDVEFHAVWPRSHIRDFGLETGKEVIFGVKAGAVHTFQG